jgi:hypothetical protein
MRILNSQCASQFRRIVIWRRSSWRRLTKAASRHDERENVRDGGGEESLLIVHQRSIYL